MTRDPHVRPEDPSRLLAAIDSPTLVLDDAARVVALNQAFVDAWAVHDATVDDLAGHSLEDLEGPLDETLVQHLSRLPPDRAATLRAVSLWRPEDSERHPADIRSRPVPAPPDAPDRPALRVVQVDRSPTDSRMSQEVRRVRRLAVLGALTAGIAHDLNNQLSASLNIAHLLREEFGPSSPHARALDILDGSAREAADLARRLLSLAGRGEPEIRRIDVATVAEQAVLLIRHELPARDRFATDIAVDTGEVDADPTLIQYLVILLALSAAAALREGGDGRLTVRRVREAAAGDDGERVELEVTASVGADLSDAWGEIARIADDHGGDAEDRSTEAGLRVRVRIPTAGPRTATASGRAADARPAAPPTGRTILVIDDDAMVREVAGAMVTRLGHRAVTAGGGKEALALVRRGLVADLVVLDLMMDELDGAATLRLLRAELPGAKILISSGYAGAGDDALRADGALEKPYTLATLKETLGRLLDEP